MPNIKSAAKRDQLAKAKNAANRASRSALKTTIKKLDTQLTATDREAAQSAYKSAVKAIDRAVAKGLIHKNNASRKKSRIAKAMNKAV